MEVSYRSIHQIPQQAAAMDSTRSQMTHSLAAATTIPELQQSGGSKDQVAIVERMLSRFTQGQLAEGTSTRNEPSTPDEIRARFKKFASAALLDISKEYIPDGFSVIASGEKEGSVLAILTDQVADFNTFLESAAGSLGGWAGTALGAAAGEALGSVMRVNPSQAIALEASGAAVGGAAGGAAATAIATGTGGAAAGSAALAAGAAAWPAVAVIAAYTAFTNIKGMKDAAGGGPLTDDEIAVALDVFGADAFTQKATPDEIEKLIPKELGGIMGPALVLKTGIGKTLLGSGKHEDQIKRDRVRKHFEKIGLAERVEGSHHVQLADGSLYDIGVDGRNRLPNLDGTERRPYNTDESNPLTEQVVGWTMGITTALTGGDEKLSSDFTGYVTNAALSNAHTLAAARENILSIFSKAEIAPSQIVQSLTTLHAEEGISTEAYQAQIAGMAALFSGQVQVAGIGMNNSIVLLSPENEVFKQGELPQEPK